MCIRTARPLLFVVKLVFTLIVYVMIVLLSNRVNKVSCMELVPYIAQYIGKFSVCQHPW